MLTKVVQLFEKLGVEANMMHDVIDSIGRRNGRASTSKSSIARRVFFDYPEILKEWYTNPRFTDSNGAPAKLRIHRGRRSFGALVRQVESRADPAEALAVLLKSRAVTRHGRDAVRARSRVFNTSGSNSLNAVRLLCVVDAIVTMVDKNFQVRARDRFSKGFYERAATNRYVDARCLHDFHVFLREQGDDFMQTMDDWLSAHSRGHPTSGRPPKTFRVGTGIYMFASD
jgi:hypothetical protein